MIALVGQCGSGSNVPELSYGFMNDVVTLARLEDEQLADMLNDDEDDEDDDMVMVGGYG
jgi:hypothetical protein